MTYLSGLTWERKPASNFGIGAPYQNGWIRGTINKCLTRGVAVRIRIPLQIVLKMKQIKPGQLCTINRKVYRCKKCSRAYTKIVCERCAKENNSPCILRENKPFAQSCHEIFGSNFPILVK